MVVRLTCWVTFGRTLPRHSDGRIESIASLERDSVTWAGLMSDTSHLEFLALQEALVGRYSLQRELGRGGMGIVYLAHEVRLDRPVALKLLPSAYAAQPSLKERFLQEARTAGKLSHPNIVPIYAVDEVDDFVFFAMAFVEGESLGQRVRERGPLRPPEAARILREVAWALGYAHAQGVVHRDIKPDNILLEAAGGRALVTDFGIAQLVRVRASRVWPRSWVPPSS
jgi:eukaryotic-like serine/threonine-protein kinase